VRRVGEPAHGADPAGPERRFFDLWSAFYDFPLVQRLTYRPVHDAVLDVLRRSSPRRVLDVGCGTGLLATRLRRELDGAHVVGCDFSGGMLRHAAARRPPLAWVQGDALHLPFRAASFEAVLSTESFHWFPDPDAALAEFFRVLAPHGRVLIALVNPPLEAVSRVARLASQLAGEPLEWPTRERMRARVEAAGFRVEAQRRILRIPLGVLLPPVLTVCVRPE
jgi:ubiquinone/menaquinone biosynthesis C-methylase UbiE